MTAQPSVLTFGEALVGYATTENSLREATHFTRFAGGADLNVAVGLARLKVKTAWASVLGDDPHGDYLADTVADLGVTTLVRRVQGPTALMFKAGGAFGDPEVLQVRRNTAFGTHADALLTDDFLRFDGFTHLHLTGIVLAVSPVVRATALTLLDAALAAGLTVSFDPNLRLNLWPDQEEMRAVVNSVAARAALVLPGITEGRLLTGTNDPEAIAAYYLSRGAQEVAVKLGAEGARAWTANGRSARSQPVQVTPIDTVGAGDGFAAGYLAGLLNGASLQERLNQAAAVGALVTTRRGDLTAMPNSEEVQQLVGVAQTARAG
jgi:sugar/nucleoside kinase (ribokinase family)